MVSKDAFTSLSWVRGMSSVAKTGTAIERLSVMTNRIVITD